MGIHSQSSTSLIRLENILIIGNGGRENSLAWAIQKNELVKKVYLIPGNAGSERINKCERIKIDINDRPINTTNLTLDESSYVLKIQNNLNEYLDIWTLIDNIWHLKPLKIEFMNKWKTNQEKEMFLQKGKALQNEKLSNFLRMLNVSIPHKSFDFMNTYALLLIDQERNLVKAGLNL